MTIQDLGSIGELIAAMATIATLFYLALQIKKQTHESRLAATRELAVEVRRVIEPIVDNKEMAAIYLAGVRDYEALPDDDRVRFSVYLVNLFRAMEQQYLHLSHGTMDPVYFESMAIGFKETLSLPGVQRWWALSRNSFDQGFGSHIEDMIQQAQATNYDGSFTKAEEHIAESVS
jgi:hypothetical protein